MLGKLKINKSPGPDDMHPHFLREMAAEIGDLLRIILINHWSQSQYQMSGKREEKLYCIRRVVISLEVITGVLVLHQFYVHSEKKLVREHFIAYMENNLFSKKQYGFITI